MLEAMYHKASSIFFVAKSGYTTNLKTFLLTFVEFVYLQSYHLKVRDSNY